MMQSQILESKAVKLTYNRVSTFYYSEKFAQMFNLSLTDLKCVGAEQ